MGFAERNGFTQEKTIQVNYIDTALRNRLYNEIHKFPNMVPYYEYEVDYVVDRMGYCVKKRNYYNWETIDSVISGEDENVPWYMPYVVIELFFEVKRKHCKECKYCPGGCQYCEYTKWFISVNDEINIILEQEKSGYRLVNDKLVSITNDQEIASVSHTIECEYESVSVHMDKALSLYSDKTKPDYENSIKESISAVEALCCIITGETGRQATLGKTLNKLEENGVVIHEAMKEAFKKLYGYTSDAQGIRHGGMFFENASEEDAKYMLVSCSAFINFLLEKLSKHK